MRYFLLLFFISLSTFFNLPFLNSYFNYHFYGGQYKTQNNTARMDFLASINCPSTPASSPTEEFTSGEIDIDFSGSAQVDFTSDAYSSIPSSVNPNDIKVELITKLEITNASIFLSDVANISISTTAPDNPLTEITTSSLSSSGNNNIYTGSINLGNFDPMGVWTFTTGTSSNFPGIEFFLTMTVKLSWSQPALPCQDDETICDATSLTLTVVDGQSNYSYIWSPGGETTSSITVDAEEAPFVRTYSVTVTDDGGIQTSDEIEVTFNATQKSFNEIVCFGEGILLADGSGPFFAGEDPQLETTNSVNCSEFLSYTITQHPEEPGSSFTQELCPGEVFTFQNQSYDLSNPGPHSHTFQNRFECDSIVTFELLEVEAKSGNNPQTICSGESYSIGDNTYMIEGIYTDILTTAQGCDSTVTTILTVHEPIADSEVFDIQLCSGDDFMGQTVTSDTQITEWLKYDSGCDSILQVFNISILNFLGNEDNPQQICEGNSYTINGNTYVEEGTYRDTLKYNKGCDSIVIETILSVVETINKEFDVSICDGKSYSFGDEELTMGGDYTQTFTSVNQCDSVVTIHLTVSDLIATEESVELCFGESFEGIVYNRDTVLVREFPDPNDCDSVHTVTIEVLPELDIKVLAYGQNCTSTGLQAFPEGGSGTGYIYQWSNGSSNPIQPVLPDGTYTITVTDSRGCVGNGTGEVGVVTGIDVSYQVTHISCNGENNGAIDLTVFGSPPFDFDWSHGSTDEDIDGLAAGVYTVKVTDANGCVYSTTLQVNEPSPLEAYVATTPSTTGLNGTATAIVSGGKPPYTFSWTGRPEENLPYIDGLGIGTYFVTIRDANGCELMVGGEVFSNATSTYQLDELKDLVIAPNPSDGQFNVLLEFDSSKDIGGAIYTIHGQRIYDLSPKNGLYIQYDIDISDAPIGTYLLILESEGKRHTERISIVH